MNSKFDRADGGGSRGSRRLCSDVERQSAVPIWWNCGHGLRVELDRKRERKHHGEGEEGVKDQGGAKAAARSASGRRRSRVKGEGQECAQAPRAKAKASGRRSRLSSSATSTDGAFEEGFRSYAKYRDLGVAARDARPGAGACHPPGAALRPRRGIQAALSRRRFPDYLRAEGLDEGRDTRARASS